MCDNMGLFGWAFYLKNKKRGHNMGWASAKNPLNEWRACLPINRR